jgi:hypothetical protein
VDQRLRDADRDHPVAASGHGPDPGLALACLLEDIDGGARGVCAERDRAAVTALP